MFKNVFSSQSIKVFCSNTEIAYSVPQYGGSLSTSYGTIAIFLLQPGPTSGPPPAWSFFTTSTAAAVCWTAPIPHRGSETIYTRLLIRLRPIHAISGDALPPPDVCSATNVDTHTVTTTYLSKTQHPRGTATSHAVSPGHELGSINASTFGIK